MNATGIIILAAGNSSRLRRPKQLLSYQGKTLLQHIIDEALAAQLHPVVVVTGANSELISQSIYPPVRIAFNQNWQEGMASGIAAGTRALLATENIIEAVILAVCDQPFVSSELFLQLINVQKQTGKGIVASHYANTMGTPVLFTQYYFSQLINLWGKGGAKQLLETNQEDVASVSFPKGNIDIDTEDDYEDLLKNKKRFQKKVE